MYKWSDFSTESQFSGVYLLLWANALVFLAQSVGAMSPYLYSNLALSFLGIFRDIQVWQFFTYMFLHGNFLHIFFNLYILYSLGSELERMWSPIPFLQFYFFCGIGAGVFVFLVDLITFFVTGVVSTSPTIGASGAIMGLFLSYAMYYPDREVLLFFLFPVKMKNFIFGFFGFSFVAIFLKVLPGVSHSGHVGGILSAILYFKLRGESSFFRGSQLNLESIFSWKKLHLWKNFFSGEVVLDFLRKKILSSGPGILDETTMNKKQVEETIDELLEKISLYGIKSLSEKEKSFLQRVSKSHSEKFPT